MSNSLEKCKNTDGYNIFTDLERKTVEFEKVENEEYLEYNEKIKKYFKKGINNIIFIQIN